MEAEAHYNIGLCYTWLGKKDEADKVFNAVLKLYPANSEVAVYTKFGLACVDIQRRNFVAAINLLQNTLNEYLTMDEEFCSVAQFQIGRIYLVYLKEPDKAKTIFQEVLEKYPNSKITEHPFFKFR